MNERSSIRSLNPRRNEAAERKKLFEEMLLKEMPGANVNQQDQYGRSPLHVAAAVDYAEMVEFLLQNGADIDIQTSGEGQTAIHYAAKNDAINSLQMLLGYGANIDARDSKNRTPLQVAAEMNRSKVAKHLICEGAPAGVYDNLGNSALCLLIEKIPEVALKAMDQFHSVDTINRKEFYFLNYLEGTKLKEKKTPARTPLEIAVQNDRFDIIMHPVMQRLISVKWQMYGKWGAILDLITNLVYTVLWTVLAVTLPNNGKHLYLPLVKNSWRLIIGILLILFTILEIKKQIMNTTKTRHELKNWREWRAAELERDLAYCHPRWPQEAQYLQAEIKAVRNLSLISGSDWWIYFDWAALVLILATIASHVTFFHYSNDTSKEVHHYILIPLLLILWLRIFKYARPFEGAGPFVVIFGHVLGDIVKWAFLNSIIVIPFTCAFWITFGAISLNPVPGYDTLGPLLYNIFSMMVVNDHGYKNLEAANPVMARLLCGAFIGIAAIITLNLLIALLSNTFERLYENAVENAVMQRARTILLLQKSLRKKQKNKYYDFIKNNGSPEVIVKTLGRLLMMDGDDRTTIESVHDDVKFIAKILGEKFGRKFGKGKKSDLDFVKMDVSKVRRFQEELMVDVKNMKDALQKITEKVNKMDNTSARDMKQILQEIPAKIEEIKDSIAKNNNDSSANNVLAGSNLATQSNEHVEKKDYLDDAESASETEMGDNSETCNKDKKLAKRKHGSERPDCPTDAGYDNGVKVRQYQPNSTTSDIWQQNAEINNSQYSYPTSYGVSGKNKFDVETLSASFETSKAHDQKPTTWPNNSRIYPQDEHAVANPLLQQRHGFTQPLKHNLIPQNFNQLSSSYDMTPAESLYFDKSLPEIYPPQVKDVMSLHSSPYARPFVENDHLQQQGFVQTSKKSNGYQNYGFSPNDKDMYQHMSGGYTMMSQNSSAFPEDKYRQSGIKVIQPMVSHAPNEQPGTQQTPILTQITIPKQADHVVQHPKNSKLLHAKHYSAFQKGTQQNSTQREIHESSGNQESETEISKIQRQIQSTYILTADHDTMDQTTPIQSVSEKEIANEDNELETPTASLVIQSNGENNKNQGHRPLTLISSQVQNKVNFYERIATVHTNQSEGYEEETNLIPSPEIVEDCSSVIPDDVLAEPAPNVPILNNIDITKLASGSDEMKILKKNSNSDTYSVSDEQPTIEEYQNSSTSQETTEDLQDITTPLPHNDLDVKIEKPEEVSLESTEEEIPDPLVSPMVHETLSEVKI